MTASSQVSAVGRLGIEPRTRGLKDGPEPSQTMLGLTA